MTVFKHSSHFLMSVPKLLFILLLSNILYVSRFAGVGELVIKINCTSISSKTVKKERTFLTQRLPLRLTKKTLFLITNITLFSPIISKLGSSKFNKLVKEKQTDFTMIFIFLTFGTARVFIL